MACYCTQGIEVQWMPREHPLDVVVMVTPQLGQLQQPQQPQQQCSGDSIATGSVTGPPDCSDWRHVQDQQHQQRLRAQRAAKQLRLRQREAQRMHRAAAREQWQQQKRLQWLQEEQQQRQRQRRRVRSSRRRQCNRAARQSSRYV